MAGKAKYIVNNGDRFGEWTVIGDGVVLRNRHRYVLCRCSCGTEKLLAIHNLMGRGNRTTRCQACSARNQRLQPKDKAISAMFLGSGLISLPRLSEEQLHELRTAIDAELSLRRNHHE